MQLLFDADPPYMRWCLRDKTGFHVRRSLFGPEWLADIARQSRDLGPIETAAYLLRHGGELRETVLPWSKDLPERIKTGSLFLPEQNRMIRRTMTQLARALPETRHVLLCDTALFTDMPAEARNYAVPESLRRRGVKRYGGSGLLHGWAWEQAMELSSQSARRVVSVVLNDAPNAAALYDGQALDTTVGFTPVEGILSRTACGDIDASVVFELRSSGMSLHEIGDLLSQKSGFRGMMGMDCDLWTLLGGPGTGKALATRDVLGYSLLKAIGAFAALLGGLDAVVFVTERPNASSAFVLDLCRRLDFTGLKARRPEHLPFGGAGAYSADDSPVAAWALNSDLWQVMTSRAAVPSKEAV
jgi:acetate kinase